MLENIRKGKTQSPPRILIYGCEGIGKSSFGASAPAPIFVPTEDGLDQIDCESFPLSETFEQFISYLTALVQEEHQYRSVIIDSLDWLERLIWSHVCAVYGVKSIEKADGGFGKGVCDRADLLAAGDRFTPYFAG